jgi:hypothetical protein
MSRIRYRFSDPNDDNETRLRVTANVVFVPPPAHCHFDSEDELEVEVISIEIFNPEQQDFTDATEEYDGVELDLVVDRFREIYARKTGNLATR